MSPPPSRRKYVLDLKSKTAYSIESTAHTPAMIRLGHNQSLISRKGSQYIENTNETEQAPRNKASEHQQLVPAGRGEHEKFVLTPNPTDQWSLKTDLSERAEVVHPLRVRPLLIRIRQFLYSSVLSIQTQNTLVETPGNEKNRL